MKKVIMVSLIALAMALSGGAGFVMGIKFMEDTVEFNLLAVFSEDVVEVGRR